MSDIGTAESGFVLTSQGAGIPPKFSRPTIYISRSGTFTAENGRGYILTAASTITLPTSPANGTTIYFIADTASNVVVTANSANVINIQNTISNYGGTATSSTLGNSLTLVYNSNATAWDALNVIGTWTLSTFLPSSLSATKYLWMDGADPLGTGTPPGNGTNVLPVDKFSVVTLSQSNSTKRPVFNSNFQNSLGSLVSTAANVTAVTSSVVAYTSTMSFIGLMTPSTAANTYTWGSTGGGNFPAFLSNFGGLSYEFYDGADRYTISAGATGVNLLEVYQTDATSVVAYLNGTQVFTHVPTVAISGKSLSAIFAATNTLNPSTMTISEMIFYKSVLTTAQQLNIRRYIAQKWALSIAS